MTNISPLVVVAASAVSAPSAMAFSPTRTLFGGRTSHGLPPFSQLHSGTATEPPDGNNEMNVFLTGGREAMANIFQSTLQEFRSVDHLKELGSHIRNHSSLIRMMMSPSIYSLAPDIIKLVEQRVDEVAEHYEYNPTGDQVPLFPSDSSNAFQTLYEEANQMLEASMFMYVRAEIRSIAAEAQKIGDYDESTANLIQAVLQLPLDIHTAKLLLSEHQDVIIKAISDQQHEQVSQAFTAWAQAMAENNDTNEIVNEGAKLLKFKDATEKDGIVYAIGVFPARKRVTLAFRGTNTQTDALQDIRVNMRGVSNPLQDYDNQPDNIRYHEGFYGYLRDQLPKIKEEVEEVMKKYPGYTLYCTGHSLGAALATMCSFELAASDSKNIPFPVSCISLASPYVGDEQFRTSFQLLEAQGKLRHLRVHNKGDLVTVLPFVALPFNPDHPSFYKHVGIGLELAAGDFRLHYQKPASAANAEEEDSFERRLMGAFKRTEQHVAGVWKNSLFSNIPESFESTLQNHLGQYNTRLTSNEAKLEYLSLNDLYADPVLVGGLKELVGDDTRL